jgi:cytosine/adenosine deaminase-related metal-dependent hydrolase
MRTTIASPRDITDAQAASYVADFTAATEPVTRLAVHMCEGVTGNNVNLEFASFAGRDTRTNRHAGISLLEASDGSYRGTGYLIHSVALTDAELMEAAATDAKIVWSPSSNMVLYGRTADIARILELGITVGLGPDWTLSGEDDMLAEMRFALSWAASEGVTAVTPEALWRMATIDGAEVVGLSDAIGTLEVGKRADVTVFGRVGADPYRAVIESDASDISLVLIDGDAYYGELAYEMATSVNGECEMLDACGAPKFVCVANTPGSTSRAEETMEDIRTQLFNILEGIGYPPDEQYGRGSELLELVSCP